MDNTCNLTFDPKSATVIGAGGFGTVYEQTNGIVLKAIVSVDACMDASLELQKQRKIFDAFQDLKSYFFANNLVKLIQKYVQIGEPYDSCNNSIIIQDKKYSCYFTMSKLYGIPLTMISELDPSAINKFDPRYLDTIGTNFELMLQLSFNSELPTGVYGREYSKKRISSKNPVRGYFINTEADVLEDLRENYGFELSNSQLQEIIGFIYGFIFYYCKIIPIDIEIALGYYDGMFDINVLDFGMTIDISKPNEIPKNPRTLDFINILGKTGISKKQMMNDLAEKIISDISIDLYSDIESDPNSRYGWNLAQTISSL